MPTSAADIAEAYIAINYGYLTERPLKVRRSPAGRRQVTGV
jgi:hypothetical protein